MKQKKGFLYILGVGMAMSALLASCADDESFSTSRGYVLSFSVDTLKMDTTFSNAVSYTHLDVYKRQPQDTLVRFALMATHTREQVEQAVQILKKIFVEEGIIK